MAGLAVASSRPDRCILSACSGSFTARVEQLAVASHTSVEIWQIDTEGQPEVAACIPMYASLQQVFAMTGHAESGLDWLLLLTADAKCTLLEWCQSSKQWTASTISIEVPGDTVQHRLQQACCSCAVQRKESKAQYVQWAIAAFEGVIHVLRVTVRAGQCIEMTVRAFWTGKAPADSYLLAIQVALSLACLVLCRHHGSATQVLATQRPQ